MDRGVLFRARVLPATFETSTDPERFRFMAKKPQKMSSGSGSERASGGDVTLAFVLDALEEFADPRAVFADARRWSRHVGVVGDDPSAVSAYATRHGLQQDYELGTLETYAVLSKLKWEADTDRYVLVGSSEEDEALADYVGWEYISVEDAAEKADWILAENAGILERVRTRLSRLSVWA